jgi:hypothetical protein
MADSFTGFFASPNENSKSAIISIANNYGMNTDLAPAWFDSLKDVLDALNSGDGDIVAITDAHIEKTYEFFRSQTGLESFPDSPEMRAIENNEIFFVITDQALNLAQIVKQYPQPSAAFYHERTAAHFAFFLQLWSTLEYPAAA